MEFAQICDLVKTDAAPAAAAAPLDLSAFPGLWLNANPGTQGIARLTMTATDDELSLQVFAIAPDGLIDWGAARVNVFTASATSRTGAGFTGLYDFGFAETRLQGNINKGLLVLAQFHRFKDESRRVDYFVREYFALSHGRY